MKFSQRGAENAVRILRGVRDFGKVVAGFWGMFRESGTNE